MRRPAYEPLQPLPVLEFEPDATVTLPTVRHGYLSFPVESVGAYGVTILPDPPFEKMTDGDEYAVIHLKTGACFVVFSDLRVARAFAKEISDSLDFDSLVQRARMGDQAPLLAMNEYLLVRKKHPALIDYDVVKDVLGNKKS